MFAKEGVDHSKAGSPPLLPSTKYGISRGLKKREGLAFTPWLKNCKNYSEFNVRFYKYCILHALKGNALQIEIMLSF